MARPSRCRRVCAEPVCGGFTPRGETCAGEVVLTVDEYEAIRLVDYEKKTHEQCAAQMEVSRTTVTALYERARQKIADSLVNGKALSISGGHYRLCRGEPARGCGRRCPWAAQNRDQKGGAIMKIAVTYENGLVFQHFGHTRQMKIYEVADGKVAAAQVVDTAGSGHGALAGFLAGLKVDVLICGGIGAGAQEALAHAGIRLYGGVTGGADEAVNAFLSGTLDYNADVRCDHHEHHDRHGEGHCGEEKHGCAGSGGTCGA